LLAIGVVAFVGVFIWLAIPPAGKYEGAERLSQPMSAPKTPVQSSALSLPSIPLSLWGEFF
jgi:hypothetical protein